MTASETYPYCSVCGQKLFRVFGSGADEESWRSWSALKCHYGGSHRIDEKRDEETPEAAPPARVPARATPVVFNEIEAWLEAMPDRQALRRELDTLKAIHKWALDEFVKFAPGDAVKFISAPNTNNGWRPYHEVLVVGAEADVMDVGFNQYGGYWFAEIILRREWSVTFDARPILRYWNGPVDETPEGMVPPKPFDQTNYPQGRKHTFSIPVQHLARLTTERT